MKHYASKQHTTTSGYKVNNMYQVIREQTRPNIDVKFFSIHMCEDEVIKYWDTVIVDSGRQISSTHTISEDGLTLTSTFLYRSRDDWHEMAADKYLHTTLFKQQTDYNKQHNIIRIFKSAFEI
jgi:hypothetical protein